jgi:hypothetical protein
MKTVLSSMPKRVQPPDIPPTKGLEGEGRVIPSETGPASHRALFLPQRPSEVSRVAWALCGRADKEATCWMTCPEYSKYIMPSLNVTAFLQNILS